MSSIFSFASYSNIMFSIGDFLCYLFKLQLSDCGIDNSKTLWFSKTGQLADGDVDGGGGGGVGSPFIQPEIWATAVLDWPLTGALDGSSPATPGCLTIFVPPRNIPTQRSTPKCDTLHHWPPPIQEKYRTFFFVIFHDIAILLLIPGWQGVFVCGPFGHIARAVIYVNYIAI